MSGAAKLDWRGLAAFGFSVFPLKARDKRPLMPWERFQTEHPTTDELAKWSADQNLNCAIATGAVSGVFILDTDSDDAEAEVQRLGIPKTPTVRTAKGRHRYFKHPGGEVKNRTGIFPRCDVRGDGGYVVAAGSTHPNGSTYEWEVSPADVPFVEAPQWLIDLVHPKDDPPPEPDAPEFSQGGSAYAEAALDKELASVRRATKGTRNNALNRAAFCIGQFVGAGCWSEGHVRDLLLSTAVAIGLEEGEALSTIKSGMSAGMKVPRAPADAEDDSPQLREMNERHAVIQNYGGRTRVMTDGDVPQFQEVNDFKNGMLNRFIDVGKNTIPLAQWWLKQPLCRKYERVEFLPGLEPKGAVFNLWRGWTVKARAGECSKFLEFVGDIICAGDATHQAWLLDWMAHAVQRPYEPGEVAVALRGGQGIGKSFFVERFGELFGRHFVPLTDPKHVVGNFNAILQSAILVFADEAFAANDKRTEGILKGLVTQPHITIEPKGVDAFKAQKFLRLVLASNSGWVIPAELDDRRFLMLDVSAARKRDRAYFAAIVAEWNGGGREALMHHLVSRDISNFDHRARPDTAALMDQKIRSLRGAQRVAYEFLHQGVVAWSLKTDDEGRVFVATQELHKQLRAKCSVTAFARELAHLAGDQGARESCNGTQRRGFWLLPLAAARAAWSAAVGIEPMWPPDDGAWEVDAGAGWL